MRLIDADANIETMKKCAANPESEQALLCYRFAQRILEEAPTVELASPWHRVEEELPPMNTNVLICKKTYGWNGEQHLSVTIDCFSICPSKEVAAWMPLPEPPKEDA